MATQYVAGFNGSFTWGGTDLKVTAWKATLKCEMLETTNTSTGGYRTYLAGLIGGEGTANAYYDLNAEPGTNPPNLQVGQLATARLYVNATNYYSWSALVSQFEPELKVDGLVQYTLSFQITAAITYPA